MTLVQDTIFLLLCEVMSWRQRDGGADQAFLAA